MFQVHLYTFRGVRAESDATEQPRREASSKWYVLSRLLEVLPAHFRQGRMIPQQSCGPSIAEKKFMGLLYTIETGCVRRKPLCFCY